VQERRLADRSRNMWRTGGMLDEPVLVSDPGYKRAIEDLKRHSDTRWSPWRMIDGDDEDRAALAALEAVAEAWSKAMPSEPARLVGSPDRAA
jgi:polyphosphate kinase 2 (PPK2 family)